MAGKTRSEPRRFYRLTWFAESHNLGFGDSRQPVLAAAFLTACRKDRDDLAGCPPGKV